MCGGGVVGWKNLKERVGDWWEDVFRPAAQDSTLGPENVLALIFRGFERLRLLP